MRRPWLRGWISQAKVSGTRMKVSTVCVHSVLIENVDLLIGAEDVREGPGGVGCSQAEPALLLRLRR